MAPAQSVNVLGENRGLESWRHHDFGYRMGHTETHRQHYDRLFLQAMLLDARRQKRGWLRYSKVLLAITLSYFFYICVRTFGHFFFNYDHDYNYSVLDVDVPVMKTEDV